MRFRSIASLCLVMLGLVGCDSGTIVITDPKNLPPLTEEDKREIQNLDQKIREEEGGAYIAAQKKKQDKSEPFFQKMS